MQAHPIISGGQGPYKTTEPSVKAFYHGRNCAKNMHQATKQAFLALEKNKNNPFIQILNTSQKYAQKNATITQRVEAALGFGVEVVNHFDLNGDRRLDLTEWRQRKQSVTPSQEAQKKQHFLVLENVNALTLRILEKVKKATNPSILASQGVHIDAAIQEQKNRSQEITAHPPDYLAEDPQIVERNFKQLQNENGYITAKELAAEQLISDAPGTFFATTPPFQQPLFSPETSHTLNWFFFLLASAGDEASKFDGIITPFEATITNSIKQQALFDGRDLFKEMIQEAKKKYNMDQMALTFMSDPSQPLH